MNDHDLTDRLVGAYLGGAIGDALAGPVEGWHADDIRGTYGRVDDFRAYDEWLRRGKTFGYTRYEARGSVTDDTYIRTDFGRYLLAHPTGRSPESLAKYLLENATFHRWWKPAIVPLRRIEAGEVTPRQAGRDNPPGGGIGWWTLFGMFHTGRPSEAAREVRELSTIWKQPLEQHLAGAVQAGLAEATTPGATVGAVVASARAEAGPLGRKLIDRGVAAAAKHAGDLDGLIEEIYATMLVRAVTGDADGPMPENPGRPDAATYRAQSLFAEQVPVAIAALVFGQGDVRATMEAVATIGLDTDSIATTTGSLIGGLVGRSGIPDDWVELLQTANRNEIDLLADAGALAERTAALVGVR